MYHPDDLLTRLGDRTARIGVIGLGYVGLPLLRAFHEAGFPTLGFDVDPDKIDALHAGRAYLKHLGEDFIRDMAASGRSDATGDFGRLGEVDAVMVCVPTPLGAHREPDLSYVAATTAQIAETLRPGQLVVLESTTYPGTTRDVVLPRLEESGLACGRDFFLAYSPEREDPGRKDASTRSIPKVVGGVDEASAEAAVVLYEAAVDRVVRVSSAEVAEASKLLENIYRAVNIALVNELKVLLTAIGVDVWEVIRAAATKPFGFQPFYPGPGLGGHCIPIDPFYLTWRAREAGLPTRFIELAGEVNLAMPEYVVQRTLLALNHHGKCLRDARILVLGLAYKPDVDDVRESPSLEIIERLDDLGAHVDYNDPHLPVAVPTRRYDLGRASVPLTPDSLRAADCVLVLTHHSAYDWDLVAEHAPLVVDTRGVMRTTAIGRGRLFEA
ncbi:MAG: nucleotide sugar dehydrogenase [Myxococcota bacterium]